MNYVIYNKTCKSEKIWFASFSFPVIAWLLFPLYSIKGITI